MAKKKLVQHDEAYWRNQFQAQESLIRNSLPRGEEFKQCLDKESWGGRYYNPIWVVTDQARVWSLRYKRFLNPYNDGSGKRNQNGEYSQRRYYLKNDNEEVVKRYGLKSKSTRILLHGLVACYYADRRPIELFGEDDVEIHHIMSYREDAGYVWNNRREHIQYIRKEDHYWLNSLQAGEGSKMNVWTDTPGSRMAKSIAVKKVGDEIVNNLVYIQYDETGKPTYTACVFTFDDLVWLKFKDGRILYDIGMDRKASQKQTGRSEERGSETEMAESNAGTEDPAA